jgi:hypothetical protein
MKAMLAYPSEKLESKPIFLSDRGVMRRLFRLSKEELLRNILAQTSSREDSLYRLLPHFFLN